MAFNQKSPSLELDICTLSAPNLVSTNFLCSRLGHEGQ